MGAEQEQVGFIVRGSLAEGLEMKLSEARSIEQVRQGRFVVIQGVQHRFFSMVTDVALGASSPQLLLHPPRPEEELLRQVLAGTSLYGSVQLRPMLMLPVADEGAADLLPVKTIPPHFSPVFDADAEDVSRVFGREGEGAHFTIGTPLEMDDTPVCLNLERFVERSNGIFGKSGTGKTFLTRICLCGIIRERAAVCLVLDMHSEYGWAGTTEDRTRGAVRGLKQLFQGRVLVCSLDPDSSRRRGVPVEFPVRIPYSQVTVEDIALLERELNLSSTAVETGYLLVSRFGPDWLASLLGMDAQDLKQFADESGAHHGALSALKRKLNVLQEDCQGFLKPSLPPEDDAVRRILSALEDGKHVVLEFGQYAKPLQYMLVANILTRRIHRAYVRRTEEAGGDRARMPRPLVIAVEEAHKFLSPGLAGQTIFGTIAREMRKYNVTLLVVDQRPSGIDPEVLSQIGTRLLCLLDDERDVDAALAGTPNAAGLRGVLATLDSRQQALILGHAVPMPIVVKTRVYDDEAFRRALGCLEDSERTAEAMKGIARDFPD